MADIVFTSAPGGPVPGIFIEINFAGLAGVEAGENDVTVFAEGLPGGGTLADGAVSDFLSSHADVLAAVGDRSPAALQAAIFFDYDNPNDSGRPKGRLRIARIGEDADGTAAVQKLTFATNATKDGSWVFSIGGMLVVVPVQTGDTPTEQALKFKAAYDALPAHQRMPIAVTLLAGVATLTATFKGLHINDAVTEVITDPGVTTTALFDNANMGGAGGAAVPGVGVHAGGNLTAILALLGKTRSRFLVVPFDDDATIEELITQINTQGDGVNQKGEQLILAQVDTKTNLVTAATGFDDGDDGLRVVFGGVTGSKSWKAVIAADLAAANSSESNNARSRDGMLLKNTVAPPATSVFNRGDMQNLLENGVTPIFVAEGETVARISRWVMLRTSFGVIDAGVVAIMDEVRDRVGKRLALANVRASLVADDQPVFAAHVTTPKAQRGIIFEEMTLMEEEAKLVNVTALFSQVVTNLKDSSTLQLAVPAAMLPQYHNTQLRLDAQIGG